MSWRGHGGRADGADGPAAARSNPATLETRLAQGLLGAVLPAARKSRYWDSFRQVYGEIAREAEDDFQAVFGRAFARDYMARTRKEES